MSDEGLTSVPRSKQPRLLKIPIHLNLKPTINRTNFIPFWGRVLGRFWGRFSVVEKRTGTNQFPLIISL